MKRALLIAGSWWLVACSDGAGKMDAAIGDLSVPDLAGHCVASTPPTRLTEGPCSYAPPNGYCFVEFPDPAF